MENNKIGKFSHRQRKDVKLNVNKNIKNNKISKIIQEIYPKSLRSHWNSITIETNNDDIEKLHKLQNEINRRTENNNNIKLNSINNNNNNNS